MTILRRLNVSVTSIATYLPSSSTIHDHAPFAGTISNSSSLSPAEHAVLRVEQAFHGVIHVGLRDGAFDLLFWLPSGCADSSEEDIRERSVHGNALRILG